MYLYVIEGEADRNRSGKKGYVISLRGNMTGKSTRELTTMENPILLESMDGGIARLVLNRPSARNSLSLDMIAALHEAVDRLGEDVSVRVIVITAEGPAFCAGHDLKEISSARANDDRGYAFFTRTMESCAAMMQAIVRCPKPVIAGVRGVATAAGCQLVASCDLAIAGEESGFATPGVNIGLFCSTPMVAVSRNVPKKRVMEMLLGGEMIDAPTAADWGLVNTVVPTADLEEAVMGLARSIASKSAATLKIGKEAFYRQAEMPLEEAYRYTAQVMVENMLEHDAEEGINAFIEKRKPIWEDPAKRAGTDAAE
jgi:enoyl-CoA hydratase/carnithine racemase